MARPKISKVLDTLETLGEIPRKAAGEVARTLSPLEMVQNQLAQKSGEQPPTPEKKTATHTPLKVEKVAGQHELNTLSGEKGMEDKKKIEELRNRLFQRVKGEEQYAIKTEAQAEQQKKEEEMTEAQQRQEAIKQRLAARHMADAPQGKEKRGGLFAKKRRKKNAVEENFVEMRGSGKH